LKILLAGATGVIGRLLLPMLVEAGHEVAGTTRSENKQEQITALGGRPMVMDALDRDAVFAILQSERPDAVIYQLTDLSSRDWAANSRLRTEGSRNVVDASKVTGVQRMIAESISWVQVPGSTPADENEPLDLDAAGARAGTVAAVQALEQAVAEMPVGVVLRYGNLYGPGTWFSRDGFTTQQVRNGEITANDAITSHVHVEDAARAALLALDWPAGIYHIVDDAPAPASEWVTLYASLVGAPVPSVTSGRQGWERGQSNAKARSLGWTPTYPDWHEGFKAELSADATPSSST
jgi:nucleoside-diphosphate-sugar epimerase